MAEGNDAKWNATLSAASRLAPADEWRASIARTLREATRAELAYVITCPPGDWGQHFQGTTHPFDYTSLTRAAETFLPRIKESGESFDHAIPRYGRIYAPLDVARHRPLAEEMRATILAPADLRGWVVTSVIDDANALIGVIIVGTRRESAAFIEHAGARLLEVSSVAARTLGGALRLAAGCSPQPARRDRPEPKSPLALLTTREREIAELVASGLRNANIAARLDIAEATVAVHLKHIYAKLGIASRVELAVQCRG
jgi:DNA-binding CsgD family transcriptional regulator